jgi:cyclopropane fatty-acyl-phospholipid synthase-like methyltransferase
MTAPDGPAFYDDDDVFSTYMARRQRTDRPNDTLEKPVILALAGDLTGQRMLDLGCGDAAFGREALDQGCQSYLGLEGSRNMFAAAEQLLAGTSGAVVLANIEDWEYPAAAFDLVVSRLALHYVAEVESVFQRVHHALVDGGRFVFSVEHPVITSSDKGWQGVGQRQGWLVDDYFQAGHRLTAWMGSHVVKYHRTIENYFVSLQQAGFKVESLREAEPHRERFEDEATYRRRQRIPLFLIMAAGKR